MARLLEAKIMFNSKRQSSPADWLRNLMSTEAGRKAVNVALVANRKTKIQFVQQIYHGKNCYADSMTPEQIDLLHIPSGVESIVRKMVY